MKKVKAYAALQAKESLQPYYIERRNLKECDVAIEIHYCGVCHSDVHQVNDDWGRGNFPIVPGHEIVGIVSEVGKGVTKFKVGDRVGVGCIVDSCRICNPCQQQLQQYCVEGPTQTYNTFERDGKTRTYGGYSTDIVVNETFVLKIPNNLPLDKAAPLLCAGITTYSPLRHWNIKKGSRVAVVGLGGLGHMGVKLASAMGADVTVLSTSNKKEGDAYRLGAKKFLNTSNNKVFEENARSFDFMLNTVSAKMNFDDYFNLLDLDASLVSVGIPEQDVSFNPFFLIKKRLNFAGSLIGGIQETQEMLDFCGQHQITSDIELISIEQINDAYERVLKSDVRYRFVIDIKTLRSLSFRTVSF